jgi:hypothetical protein
VQFEHNEENLKKIVIYSGPDELMSINPTAQAPGHGRWERFDIAPGEKLMGVEIAHTGGVFFHGVTFLKWTLH